MVRIPNLTDVLRNFNSGSNWLHLSRKTYDKWYCLANPDSSFDVGNEEYREHAKYADPISVDFVAQIFRKCFFMKRCIYSDEIIVQEKLAIDEKKDSFAHVFPNSIGGHKGYRGILSKNSNSIIGNFIEKPFSDLFECLLLDINPVRERGAQLAKEYLTKDGIKVLKSPGGIQLEIAEPFKLKFGENTFLYSTSKKNNRKLIEKFQSLKDNLKLVDINSTDIFSPKIATKFEFDYAKILPALNIFACTYAAGNGLNFGRKFKKIVDKKITEYIFLCASKFKIKAPPYSITHSIIIKNEGEICKAYINVFDVFSALVFLPGNVLCDTSYGIDITTGKEFAIAVPDEFLSPKNIEIYKNQENYTNEIAKNRLITMLEVVQYHQMRRFIIAAFNFAFKKIKSDKDAIHLACDLIERKYRQLKPPSLLVAGLAE